MILRHVFIKFKKKSKSAYILENYTLFLSFFKVVFLM